MKIIYNNIIPFKGYLAINLFGILFVRKGYYINDFIINHEKIHTAQMKELWYIPFYIWYLIEWLILLIKYRNINKAYRNIRFEKEAYDNEGDLSYLYHRKKYNYIKTLWNRIKSK